MHVIVALPRVCDCLEDPLQVHSRSKGAWCRQHRKRAQTKCHGKGWCFCTVLIRVISFDLCSSLLKEIAQNRNWFGIYFNYATGVWPDARIVFLEYAVLSKTISHVSWECMSGCWIALWPIQITQFCFGYSWKTFQKHVENAHRESLREEIPSGTMTFEHALMQVMFWRRQATAWTCTKEPLHALHDADYSQNWIDWVALQCCAAQLGQEALLCQRRWHILWGYDVSTSPVSTCWLF